MKNLTSIYIVCLLTIAPTIQAANEEGTSSIQQSNQERIKLLNKYQFELHALKTKVSQLETEVFLGGYNDLIEKYQEIIQQLERDIKQVDNFSKSYSSFVEKVQTQKAKIDGLNSSLNTNTFFLLVSMSLSMFAVSRTIN